LDFLIIGYQVNHLIARVLIVDFHSQHLVLNMDNTLTLNFKALSSSAAKTPSSLLVKRHAMITSSDVKMMEFGTLEI
jgi:hypothetical protein